jgi:hypothetical protein
MFSGWRCYLFIDKNSFMPVYITKIKLQDAAEQDYHLLKTELKHRSFDPYEGSAGWHSKSAFHPLPANHFIKKGNIIQDVIDDVLSAARRTGKEFSFTIIRDKN